MVEWRRGRNENLTVAGSGRKCVAGVIGTMLSIQREWFIDRLKWSGEKASRQSRQTQTAQNEPVRWAIS